jgi:hypothetical protein
VARKKGRPATADQRDGRLSYGEPVSVDGRTVIPVTRVRIERGEGKQRTVDSVPLGFIEVSAQGSAFHPIDDPGRRRGLRAAATVATTLLGAVAGARALAPRRGPRLLPPGRRH